MSQNSDSPEMKTYNDLFPKKTINNIVKGTLERFQPSLIKSQAQLTELLQKQELLGNSLHTENLELSWRQNSVELHKLYDTIAIYQNKLANIKKDMCNIHEKSLKLKKKAIALQQYKEKMNYVQIQQKEMELQKEQGLIGK